MNRLSIKLGFWSSLLIVMAFVVYTICFVAILMTSPLFFWTNLEDYIVYTNENGHFFKDLAQFSMLLFGPLFVLLLNSVYDYTADDKKVLARASIYFGIAFAALMSTSYFVQLTAVKQNVASMQLDGIDHFVQANPNAAMTAATMLAVTLFLGLSSLFIAPVFSGSRLEKLISISFWINGISCLLGGVGYLFQITILVFLGTTIGMGFDVMAATVSLTVFFNRRAKEIRP